MKQKGAVVCVIVGWITVFSGLACINSQSTGPYSAYDLDNPEKYYVSGSLEEISGMALYKGRADSIYAVQDEDGRIYYFKPGGNKPTWSKFSGHGDYEDIAIALNQVFILRSDGTIFTFPFKQIRGGNIDSVQTLAGLLPAGEYEGMYADEKSKQLYILCKSCEGNNAGKFGRGYIFEMGNAGALSPAGEFSITVKDKGGRSGKHKTKFHPSALAKNLKTNEWYLLSSVNKALIVTDAAWKIKTVYPLNAALFVQPEGIAFDDQGNLYISNEGDKLTRGAILKFNYKP